MYRHLLSLIALALALSSTAHAAKVTQVKGDKVLVDLEGESISVGSRFIEIVDGKRKAVIEISSMKGANAIGTVLKGSASEGGALSPLASGGSSGSSQASRSRRPPRVRRNASFTSLSYGVEIGYGATTQDVTATKNSVTETIHMTGGSPSLKAFGDLPISGSFGLIGRAGFENFGVKGSSATFGAVETNILYLDADLLLRYFLSESRFKFFPLGGMGLHYPLSKTSGVLDVGRISATTIFFVGAGFDYELSRTMYIHGTLEYGIFPPSNDVKTSLISGRIGLGWQM